MVLCMCPFLSNDVALLRSKCSLIKRTRAQRSAHARHEINGFTSISLSVAGGTWIGAGASLCVCVCMWTLVCGIRAMHTGRRTLARETNKMGRNNLCVCVFFLFSHT